MVYFVFLFFFFVLLLCLDGDIEDFKLVFFVDVVKFVCILG